MIVFTVSIYIGFEPFAEGIYDADPYPVQSAGHFVTVAIELSTGVQRRQYHLQSAFLCLFMLFYRYSSAVILNCTTAVGLYVHSYAVAESGQRFINRVIQHLIDQMVQPSACPVADIHIRAFANRLQSPEYLYIARIVFMSLHYFVSLIRFLPFCFTPIILISTLSKNFVFLTICQ